MNGGIEADTVRLLKHLCNKTDTIASVLESLGQRVVGMERTFVVSLALLSLLRGIGYIVRHASGLRVTAIDINKHCR